MQLPPNELAHTVSSALGLSPLAWSGNMQSWVVGRGLGSGLGAGVGKGLAFGAGVGGELG